MGIEIKNGEVILGKVRAKLDNIEQRFQDALADEAARIDIRTRSGKDVDGNTFEPYSPQYAKFKAKRGRRVDPPDLTFTGRMLAAITTSVKRAAGQLIGIIEFSSALEGAKARKNMERRRFFGLSDEQVARLKAKLTE